MAISILNHIRRETHFFFLYLATNGNMFLPLATLIFPAVYVLPFYFGRSSLPRDHPKTIRGRIIVSTLTSIFFSWVPTYVSLAVKNPQVSRDRPYLRKDLSLVLLTLSVRTLSP